MSFTSVQFFLFLIAVVLAMVVARRPGGRRIVLLVAGDVFYAWWDWRFLLLFWFLKIANYHIGNRIHHQHGTAAGKRTLIGGILLNVLVLGFFKYYYFLDQNFSGLAAMLGWDVGLPQLSIVLPLGISFYTFQALAYLIDIHRGELKPARSQWEFALFLGFFPQVTAGPIQRGRDLLPQLREHRPLSAERFGEGAFLILWGLFKKVVVADTIGIRVDRLFTGGEVDAGVAILAGIGYSFQIYADFSAYTDMARGSARLLGYDLTPNFRQPLFARSPREFWNSWHMTFSSWLRHYIYFPLGGSRRGLARTNLNILITFLVCGLWHGASWTFVLWGVYQGVLLAGNATFVVWRRRLEERGLAPQLNRGVILALHLLAWFLTFTALAYGRILFRADSLGQALEFTGALFEGRFSAGFLMDLIKTSIYILPVVFYDAVTRITGCEYAIVKRNPVIGGLFIAALIYGLLIFGIIGAESFIYYQF